MVSLVNSTKYLQQQQQKTGSTQTLLENKSEGILPISLYETSYYPHTKTRQRHKKKKHKTTGQSLITIDVKGLNKILAN